jgi:hypothetical protein
MRRIAFGAGGVSLFIIAVALAWGGIHPHIGFGPPPEIAAPATPLRVAPSDPGGLTVPGADVQIMSGENSDAAPQLAAQPATPDISQLQAASGETPPAPPPATTPAAPATPPASTTAAPHAVLNGPIEAQLGTAPNLSAAVKHWAQLSAALPAAFKGKIPQYVPAVVNGQSVFSVSTGGFMNISSAQGFCDAVIAKGFACTVAAF